MTSSQGDFAQALVQLAQQPVVSVNSSVQIEGVKHVQNNGSQVDASIRSTLNLIPGAGVSITTADDPTNDRVSATIAALSGTAATFTSLVDIVSTTTESDMVGTQGSGWTIPANTLGATDKLVVDLDGDITVANTTSPSMRFRLYLGGTAVIDSGAFIPITGVGTPHPFRSRVVVAMRGSTSSYFAHWSTVFGSPGTANNLTTGWGISGYVATGNGGITEWTTAGDITLDMTSAQALRATLTWGTSSATNELRVRQAKLVKV